MISRMAELGIDRLSIADRLSLMEEIWDSIAAKPDDIPITDAQRTDLQLRLAEYDADPDEGSSWEEVRERLRSDP